MADENVQSLMRCSSIFAARTTLALLSVTLLSSHGETRNQARRCRRGRADFEINSCEVARPIRVRMQSHGHVSLRINVKGGYYAPSER
jgi:hypothetical protein